MRASFATALRYLQVITGDDTRVPNDYETFKDQSLDAIELCEMCRDCIPSASGISTEGASATFASARETLVVLQTRLAAYQEILPMLFDIDTISVAFDIFDDAQLGVDDLVNVSQSADSFLQLEELHGESRKAS